MVQSIILAKNRFLDFYQRHEVLVSISIFVAGFIFDLLTLGRIDNLFNLTQQAVFLCILGTLLVLEIKVKFENIQLSPRKKVLWQYHDLVVHFLFGSLLSAYTIFYYTSASAITSFIFIMLLAGLMLANEVPTFKRLGLPVRIVLFSICILSYFAFFYPIIMGRVGPLPFWLGFISSLSVMAFIWRLNFKGLVGPEQRRQVLIPGVLVLLLFLVAYYTSLIPPVPVAVKKIGVYYEVVKEDGQYKGKHLRPDWKFWRKGSQDFHARKGDKVMVLLSIFSPARFEDRVFLKWYYDHPRLGWRLEDTIPLSILGGRQEGFRGFGSKQFYTFGHWRVIVETSDDREVGRINIQISEDLEQAERDFKIDAF